jgi:hypothetical protein
VSQERIWLTRLRALLNSIHEVRLPLLHDHLWAEIPTPSETHTADRSRICADRRNATTTFAVISLREIAQVADLNVNALRAPVYASPKPSVRPAVMPSVADDETAVVDGGA